MYLFLLREREGEGELGRSRERGREGIPSRPRDANTEPDAGLKLTNHETVT